MKRAACALLGGFWCVGCVGPSVVGGVGGGQLGKPVAVFPSQAELNRVASQPVETPKSSVDMADVDSWQMQQPADTPQYPSETTWDRLVVKSNEANGNRMTLSTALRCAAEEAARFYTVNGGMPDDGLREHLLLRCGSTAPAHAFVYITGKIPDSMPLTRVEASGRAGVEQLINERFGRAGQFGLACARGHGRYAVAAFTAVERATLEPFSAVISGNTVTLSGELLRPASVAYGLVTHGAYGVERCENDPFAHVPAFHVTCPIAADDTSARIEIVSQQEGRVLLEPALEVEVRRDEHAALEYNAGAYGANKAVASSGEFRDQLWADLNRVRTAAGLTPFALEAVQSQTDERFAPALAQSLVSGDVAQETTITLGLLAGWDVHGGLIQSGGIFASRVNSVRNPSRWLTQTLESPLGRSVLLEPRTTRIWDWHDRARAGWRNGARHDVRFLRCDERPSARRRRDHRRARSSTSRPRRRAGSSFAER